MAENKTRAAPKRVSGPLTLEAEAVLAAFERDLREVEDLSPSTLRAYRADLRYFASWCE